MIKYDKNRYFKLLKSLPKSEYPKISFSEKEFFESRDSSPSENFWEIRTYLAMTICHLHWENR